MKKFINERKKIYGSDLGTPKEKAEKVNILRERLIADIESETIGFSTLYRLLSSIEDKENSQIKNLLLEVLFLCGNASFNKAIIQSKKEILQIEENGSDIEMFNIPYKITKKHANSEMKA